MKTLWGILLLLLLLLVIFPVLACSGVFYSLAKKRFSAQYPYAHYRKDYPRKECRFFSCRHLLCGYFYGEANQASPALILVAPGAGCPADGHLPEITYFVDRGWQVFSYDATGIGKSEGKSIRGLPQVGKDFEAALACVRRQKSLPIVIYAHSAGAYAACRALSKAKIAAAVCISGFDLPLDIMLYHARLHVGAISFLGYPVLALRDFFAFGKDGNRSAIRSINSVKTPVMLYQDKRDRIVPFSASLVGKKAKITNQNVRVAYLSSGHSGAWLSASAGAYADSVEADYRAMQRKYRGKPPDSVKKAFLGSIDYAKATQPNAGFLDGVLDFFSQASGKPSVLS